MPSCFNCWCSHISCTRYIPLSTFRFSLVSSSHSPWSIQSPDFSGPGDLLHTATRACFVTIYSCLSLSFISALHLLVVQPLHVFAEGLLVSLPKPKPPTFISSSLQEKWNSPSGMNSPWRHPFTYHHGVSFSCFTARLLEKAVCVYSLRLLPLLFIP